MHRRLGRFTANSFEVLIAAFGVVVALLYFVRPSTLGSDAVSQAIKRGAWAWDTLYGLAGLGILVGLWRRSIRLEVVALCIFSGSIAIQVVAIVATGTLRIGLPADISLLFSIASAWACIARIQTIFTLMRAAGGEP